MVNMVNVLIFWLGCEDVEKFAEFQTNHLPII